MSKYSIKYSNIFKKELKKVLKQGKEIDKLLYVVDKLSNSERLDSKYRDHQLINDRRYKGCRECHIEPDWLLVYKYNNDELILFLVETGSHSELFNKWFFVK